MLAAMLTITQATSDTQIAAVADLFHEYLSWVAALLQPDEFSTAPTFHAVETELATLPGIYAPPAGRLLLAEYAGQAAGCVCLKGSDTVTAELKRLYVRPAFRGQNIGQHLVQRLLVEAREAGYTRVVLDTHVSMKSAQAIYLAAGFRQSATPVDFPEQLKPLVVFMGCDLGGG
jgi:GNAT superfamily N-acetyltransferase